MAPIKRILSRVDTGAMILGLIFRVFIEND